MTTDSTPDSLPQPLINSYQRARFLLAAASVVCFAIFWGIGVMLRVPVHCGQEDSLLQQPAASVFAVLITFVVCVAIATLLAAPIRFNGGLAAAAIGLAAISWRGGSSRATIFAGLAHGSATSLFVRLLFEMFLLTVLIAACWWVLRYLYSAGTIKDRYSDKMLEEAPWPDTDELASLGIQLAVTAMLVLVFMKSELKQQALAGVFLASFFGPVVSGLIFPTGPRGGIGCRRSLSAWLDMLLRISTRPARRQPTSRASWPGSPSRCRWTMPARAYQGRSWATGWRGDGTSQRSRARRRRRRRAERY